jgi:hypothetical protein
MSGWYQNAWLLVNTMASPITTFRERPCMPAAAEARLSQDDCNSVRVVCANGVVLQWFKDGALQETLPNGDKTIFPARPTQRSFVNGSYVLAEFFLGYLSFQPRASGNYFEFHADGGIMYRHNGFTLFWSPPFPAKEVQGQITYSICDLENEDEYQFWLSERPDSVS